jgi:translocation and assembly module TamA
LSACAELRFLGLGEEVAVAEVEDREAIEKPIAEPAPGLAYEVSIEGVGDKDLLDILENASQLVTLKDRRPASLGILRRRAKGDLDRLQKVLRSEGYYAAEVRTKVNQKVDPVQVTIEVAAGPLYVLADYAVRYEDPAPRSEAQPGLEDLDLEIGMPAKASTILAAQRALLDSLGRRGYPLAKVLDRKTVVHHDVTTMTVSLSVDAGPFARFGDTTIEGLVGVERDYLRRLLAWSEAEPYDQDKVQRSRKALSDTGLFSSVQITPGSAVDPDGQLPMTVAVEEAKHRSIGFGAGYSTSEGLGGEVFWEHRNLFGRDEDLRLSLTAAEIEQVLDADFRKPGFLRPNQSLLIDGTLANRNTDAFDEQSARALVGLERRWLKNWRVTGGLSAEYSILEDEEGEETFQIFGVPWTASRDTRDDLLDPSRGTRLAVTLTPYAGRGDKNFLFGVATADASAYYAVDEEERFVLAGRAKVGTITGEDRESVPANKRFYAGGGGSIRGFEFQSVGVLDADDDPLGGRSLLELNVEVRIRLTEDFGVVPFIDGGTVFDSPYPDFDETLRFAGGLGLRYFTGFGPLRLDVAVPINKRDRDDAFQFYVSLGQAF